MKISCIKKDYDRDDIKVSGELIDITGKGTKIVMDNIGDIGLFLAHDKKTNPEKFSD